MASPPASADQRRLTRALTRLRDRLISGDGRSPSIRLLEPRPGRSFDLKSLDRVSVGLGERALAAARAGAPMQLVRAQEAGAHEGSARAAADLLALAREHRARLDETGSNDLALGYPFFKGTCGGYLVRGPLLLFPAALDLQNEGARSFTLRPVADASPAVNLPLLRVIFSKRDLALPEALVDALDELAQDPRTAAEGVLRKLDQIGLPTPRLSGSLQPLLDPRPALEGAPRDALELEECAVLGLFPRSSSDLLQDYDELLDRLDRGAPAGPLLGSASALLPADLRAELGADDEPPADAAPGLTPLLAADPAQREVLRRARAARGLVVDGPPGTGKSQVIVNLVADALGRGQRVAVVSEKRAALDVVAQRLERAGLLHATALVHDVLEDRKQVYRKIAARLEATPAAPLADATAEAEARLRQAAAPLADRAAALTRPTAAGPAVGTLLALRSGLASPALPGAPPSLGAIRAADLPPLLQRLADLAPFARLLGPGSPWSHPQRPSFAAWTRGHLDDLAAGLLRAAATAERLGACQQAAGGAPAASLAAARQAIEGAIATRPRRATLEDQAIFARLLGRLAAGGDLDAVLEAERQALSHQAALAAVPARPAAPLDEALAAQVGALLGWLGRWWRWLSPAFWRARAAAREAALRLFPAEHDLPLDAALAARIQATTQAARVLARLDALLTGLGLTHLSPRAPADALPLATRLSSAARELAPLLPTRERLRPLGLWPDPPEPDEIQRWDQRLDAALLATDALAAHGAALAPCQQTLPWLDPETPPQALRALAAALALDAAALPQADARLAEACALWPDARQLIARGSEALDGLPPGPLRRLLLATWSDAVLAREAAASPQVARLGASPALRELPALEAALADAERAAREAELARLLARLEGAEILRAPQPEKGRRRTDIQASREAILRETRKQRNLMPLRSFVRQFAARGLLDLQPAWLLSPETMTVLFPREPVFDLVIFDEASQCTVEGGLPALLRARRFVVAGDEKQMPPSAFFRATSEADADPDEADADPGDLAAESLLSLARQRVPAAPLSWHYRCESGELIAFSNHAMYGGALHTIPSTASSTAPSALAWVAVPDGKNEQGENLPEARRAVDELARLLSPGSGPLPSVGVVTMNVQQRKAILDEIDARITRDEAFARAWQRASSTLRLDERPFVKNLENVQGDERDVIVFSLGYAPAERRGPGGERVVPARFGPLGQRGGERRLNVAISRARRACIIVASFEPSQLSVDRAVNAGPRLFKQFLEFAHHHAGGHRARADRVLDLVRGPSPAGPAAPAPSPDHIPLAAQIALALGSRGLRCELDVGDSVFRVPLAVSPAASTDRHRLAVLCEEGEGPVDPLDRHLHRHEALRARGWVSLCVSAADWALDRAAVIDAIERQLAGP